MKVAIVRHLDQPSAAEVPSSGELKAPSLDVISDGRRKRSIPLDREIRREGLDFVSWTAKFEYVGPHGVGSEGLARTWDSVVLTKVEDDIIGSLRFLTPGIEKISFVGSGGEDGRIPKAKLAGFPRAVPLRSLGDGVNRALGLLLSIAQMNDSGLLLVDEIENGIHYAAHEQLWKLLIDASILFDVQIFATTHSGDCIHPKNGS
jgi:AAA domain, putative AbiEii toxin, Type IV TA system